MFATVRHRGTAKTVPVVPVSAVVQEYGKPVVFVEQTAGRYQRREVTLGNRAGDHVAVLAGVNAGERVVVDGGVLLKDR
jgi:multidrug efflux pump subunit AcrA (membrane-fusion protein)